MIKHENANSALSLLISLMYSTVNNFAWNSIYNEIKVKNNFITIFGRTTQWECDQQTPFETKSLANFLLIL